MLGNVATDRSKTYTNPTSLTTMLVGVILLYQIANYIFLKAALDDMSSDFNSELEASCAADPGLASGSSLCIEAQLFRGWNQMPSDAAESLEKLLEITPPRSREEQTMLQPSTSSVPMLAESESLNNLRPRAGEIEKKQIDMTNFSHNLFELQQRLEAKHQEQANRHAQHRALHALSVAARGLAETPQATQEQMIPWSLKLDNASQGIQHDMEDRRKDREKYLAARAAMHESRLARLKEASQRVPPLSPTALQKQLEHHSFMDEIQAVGSDLCQDPRRHDLPACFQFITSQTDQNRSLDKKLPNHPLKSYHESNEAARAHLHLLEKHLDDLEYSHDHQTAAIKAESEHLLADLCADPARSSYLACAKFVSTSGALAEVGKNTHMSNLRGQHESSGVSTAAKKPRKNLRASMQPPALSWDSMKAWVSKHSSVVSHDTLDRMPLMFHRQDERLRGQWQGRAPEVACITVLPQDQVTEMLMKTFMDNYISQEYEGERRLVIVYHQDDQRARQIAQTYANGTSITVAATFGEGRFISSTAYRYGGWLARNSDITAQWDFDAWHHPLQLSMQVRAMAVSGRPCSVVTWVTDFNVDGTKSNAVQGGFGQHGSMVGETSWMRKNWMPMIEEEQSVPSGLHAREVVQVDMPELLAYHDMKAHAQFLHP